MHVTFYCNNCGKMLDWYQESHDSIEFFIEPTNLECSCKDKKNDLIRIMVRRG